MKLIYTSLLLIVGTLVHAQSNKLLINPGIVLLKDSIESEKLTTALNDFLNAAQKPNDENKLVLESQKVETFILLDEINGIQESKEFNDAFFYKPYLTNVVALEASNFLIQVSYIGTHENNAFLRASFELIAHKKNDSFVFSSPLLRNTQNWKVEKVGNNIFHYKNTINETKVKEFGKLAFAFDSKLKSENKLTDFYCTDNLIELQKLVGVQYKSDYNGIVQSVWSSTLGDRKVVVFGNQNATFNNFDPHDLFHDRLSLVISRSKLNRAVDEGCAYLYGGSWGMTWNEIFQAFKAQVASNRNTNWAEIKETPVYFKTSGFNNSADYIVNALLVQKIEKEKGFEGVWELLNVGPAEKGNEKYYLTLENLTGITKANYNEEIWKLINDEK
ncbi:hypothetical protein DFQ04_2358 [Algoriphagus boseongensis]|uniref:Uncharacterized protein n=1 Tax=Algoriphagus boseongensis TaxID=1442587 RepID=A0A4R6T2R7_9BACT|nr:hypothetical protein [Algoriphagus boseongensis]TDQ16246.1 hypothetical protein DFQ04_2358 [Algoriphagus boseongensis]